MNKVGMLLPKKELIQVELWKSSNYYEDIYIPYSGLFSKNKFSAKSAIMGGKKFRMLLFSANQVLDQNIRVIITGMCTLFPDTTHSTHEATHGVVVVCY